MNHDYSHCLDFKINCPKDCFRAQLQRDLMQIVLPIPLKFTHFKGTKECPRNKEVRAMIDMTIQNAIHCMKAIICEEVCEECDYYGKTGTDHCEADAVRMAIKALEEQPHWIPCSERLPNSGRYLVSCSLSVFSPQVLNYDADDGEWFYDGCKSIGYEIPTINAWMPLPKPYGGESDE